MTKARAQDLRCLEIAVLVSFVSQKLRGGGKEERVKVAESKAGTEVRSS